MAEEIILLAGIKGAAYVAVIQNSTVLASATIKAGGTYTLTYTPKFTTLPLTLSFITTTTGVSTINVPTITYWHWENVPVIVTELVCSCLNW